MFLNCHSYYSFKYGTLSVDRLLELAEKNDARYVALTDINNTAACMEFLRKSKSKSLTPILGIDFHHKGKQQCIALAKNKAGFVELNALLSQYLERNEEHFPDFSYSENYDLIFPFEHVPQNLIPNMYIGVRPWELHRLLLHPQRETWAQHWICLHSITLGSAEDYTTHRLLSAMKQNTLISTLNESLVADKRERFVPEAYLKGKYQDFPQLLLNTQRLLQHYAGDYPIFQSTGHNNLQNYTGEGETKDFELLKKLTYEGLKYRYPQCNDTIIARVEKELSTIHQKQFTAYFLINWDILNYARKQGYFYVGRGSGANSIVAYCLRITDVDPIELDLYFERFINLYRSNPPDFDVDFSWKDRDDIQAYIFKHFPEKQVALLATYSTFQEKAVVRELGKVFGLPKIEIDNLLHQEQKHGDRIVQQIRYFSKKIQGFPSHLSIHAGGVLIAKESLMNFSAFSFPPKGFPIVQFDMHVAEDVGLYKFDILSQRGLGHIKDALHIVKQNKGIELDIHNISMLKKDKRVRQLIKHGKTMGCFYVESPAMRMLLTKLRADDYKSLVAASSIIRPGVAQSGMMREYILRFQDPNRTAQEAHPALLEIMPDTFGVMVYQEDVIKVAHHYAGLSLAEADVLRRGMSGKFRSRDEFQQVKQKFFDNCKANGEADEDVREIWRQIESFAGYAFSKGHSASYAVESFQSLFLKAYYPKEFMVGVINNFGGFYRTETYIHEAKMMGAQLEAPCINNSEHLACIREDEIYLGFGFISGLERNCIREILLRRAHVGYFENLPHFLQHVSISMEQLSLLIRINAFRFTGTNKRTLLWEAHTHFGKHKKNKPSPTLFNMNPKRYQLPTLDHEPHEDTFDEIELLGYPLASPFSILQTPPSTALLAEHLSQHVGKHIEIWGYLVSTKKTSTNRGDSMYFGNFLDQKGHFIDTVHFPPVAKQYPFKGRGIYAIYGKVTEEFRHYTVEVERLEHQPYLKNPMYA